MALWKCGGGRWGQDLIYTRRQSKVLVSPHEQIYWIKLDNCICL